MCAYYGYFVGHSPEQHRKEKRGFVIKEPLGKTQREGGRVEALQMQIVCTEEKQRESGEMWDFFQ